jgi:hypothetical protein
LNFLASTSALVPNTVGQEISNSVLLAAQYGVSSKTIRDIWNRKTWTHATKQMFGREHLNQVSFANIEYLDIKVRSKLLPAFFEGHIYSAGLFAASTKQSWAPCRLAKQKAESPECQQPDARNTRTQRQRCGWPELLHMEPVQRPCAIQQR